MIAFTIPLWAITLALGYAAGFVTVLFIGVVLNAKRERNGLDKCKRTHPRN